MLREAMEGVCGTAGVTWPGRRIAPLSWRRWLKTLDLATDRSIITADLVKPEDPMSPSSQPAPDRLCEVAVPTSC